MTTLELLFIDNVRMEMLNAPYDPIRGSGSLVPRFEYKIFKKSPTIFLPMRMKAVLEETMTAPSLEEYAGKDVSLFEEIFINIVRWRTREDFEFWCATCSKITPKIPEGGSTGDVQGGVIPFVLNRPQRRLAARLEFCRNNEIPIREILLKARQWGGSTEVINHDMFMVLFHVKNWNISIVAHVEEAARNIRGMITTMAKHHPKDVYNIKMQPYEGSIKARVIPDLDGIQARSVVSIGSMEKPEGMNSKDIKIFQATESGLWKKTIGKDPFNLAANIEASIPFIPYTSIVYESTAQGSGNFFHKKFTDAQKKVSGFSPFFVPWFEIERYTKPFASEGDKIRLLETLSERDIALWDAGATLEGIHWHRFTRQDYDDVYMGQHFPTTPEEAFQTTGRRVFAPGYVKKNRQYCRPPKYVGDIFAENNIENIEFKEFVGGPFWIWYKPETDIRVSDRYLVQVDIGATSEKASYSTIRVFDRIDLMSGGVDQAIATWKGHLDQDLVVWVAVRIAIYYNNAKLSYESNPIDSAESEGDHSITLLDSIAGVYDNLFTRTDPEKVRQGHPVKYGIHTNVKSKTDYVNQYKKRLRTRGYIEYDDRVNDEADTYEYKESGRMKCVDGAHDDLLENTMMGLKVSELMPLPQLIPDTPVKPREKVFNEAGF